MVVKNKIKKVLVLKALGHPVLRLLPGLNEVDAKNLNAYTKGNPAAMAMVEDHLEVINGDLTSAQKGEAAAAKKKNDKLNEASPLLKQTQAKLAKAEAAGSASAGEVAELKALVLELKEQLADALGGGDDLEAKINDAKKAVIQADVAFDNAAVGEAKGKAADDLSAAWDALKELSADAEAALRKELGG